MGTSTSSCTTASPGHKHWPAGSSPAMRRVRRLSSPGALLAVQEGEGALLASVHAAIVPVVRLPGPAVETLRMAEIFTLLGLLPDASGSAAQKHALAPAGSMVGVESWGARIGAHDTGEPLPRHPCSALQRRGEANPQYSWYGFVEGERHGTYLHSPRQRGGRHHHRSP